MFWMLRDAIVLMLAENPKVAKLGRPWKLRSPTEVRYGNEMDVSNWRSFNVNFPPIDCSVSAPKDVMLVAPSAMRSPVIDFTEPMLILSAVFFAMVMLPVKVVQPAIALASPWFWISRGPFEAVHAGLTVYQLAAWLLKRFGSFEDTS